MKEELKKLNPAQLAAVKHGSGPLLVVAGAGTGKTRVLIDRLAYLILEKKVPAESVLLLTFTEKAAGEMVERADRILPYGCVDLWIHTFHGWGERILRQQALEIGLNPEFRLLDGTAQWIFFKKNLACFNFKYYASLSNPNKFIREILNHFSRLKDENISGRDYLKLIEKKGRHCLDPAEKLEVDRQKELAEAFELYNRLLLENNYLDFGDLINYAIKLFRSRPNILATYQKKFKYVMVDEFQDTNSAQYELIKILAENKNLMVVGDDDQSIYKFRGASISNIMQFKDDYPEAQEIVLNSNYRSRQEILDCAYRFIRHNDPERLEVKLKIDKRLKAEAKFDSISSAVNVLNFAEESDELSFVGNKIKEIYQREADTTWMDFAILSRSNETADKYAKELTRLGLPNHFVSLKGLYNKPIILDVISYFKLLDNYRESSALYRVLNMEEFKLGYKDLNLLAAEARRSYESLFEVLRRAGEVKGLDPLSLKRINELLDLIDRQSKLVGDLKPSSIFVRFIHDGGILKNLNHEQDREVFSYLNQFYQKMKKFENEGSDWRLKDFIEALDFELEAGDSGKLKNDFADVDTIKVMTVHSAKGLEFKYVFLVDLVERRFPSDKRSEKIPLAEELFKEKKAGGDNFHLEEERRLFYVALTRAKQALWLTSSRDYGGAREKKPSLFLGEIGIDIKLINDIDFSQLELLRDLELVSAPPPPDRTEDCRLPDYFSFSQFAAHATCPLQYKYAHILKIPSGDDKPSLVFGRVIHNCLYNFLLPLVGSNNLSLNLLQLSQEKLLDWYRHFWQDEGYGDTRTRDEYRIKGENLLKKFYQDLRAADWPEVCFLEKDFRFKFGQYFIKGKIDRLDKMADGRYEIIDYKTGSSKEKLAAEDRRQLLLYQVVAEASFGLRIGQLTYYYLEDGRRLSFEAKEKDLAGLEDWLKESITEIEKREFVPKPGKFTCPYCDFRGICEFRS